MLFSISVVLERPDWMLPAPFHWSGPPETIKLPTLILVRMVVMPPQVDSTYPN